MWCVSCCEGGGGSAASGDWRPGAGEWFAQCRQGGRKSRCCSDEPYPLSQNCNIMRTLLSPLKYTYLPTYKAQRLWRYPPCIPRGLFLNTLNDEKNGDVLLCPPPWKKCWRLLLLLQIIRLWSCWTLWATFCSALTPESNSAAWK